MNKIRRIRKNKEATKKNFNRIKSLTLKIALIFLNFIFATFAWFIYQITLDTNVDVKVSAWKVDFKENDTSIESDVQFEIENFYPGMTDYKKTIEIENLGERSASIEYQVDSLKILGRTYTVKEAPEEGDSADTLYSNKTVSGGKNVVKLLNDSSKFPFEIILTYTQEIYTPSESDTDRNKGIFEIHLTWPYEISGTAEEIAQKNSLDTLWGRNIAKFYDELPEGDTTHGIEIQLQAIAKQIID